MILSGLRGQLMLHEDTDTAPVAAANSATAPIAAIPQPGKAPNLAQILADTVSAAKINLQAQKEVKQVDAGEAGEAKKPAELEKAAGEATATGVEPGEPTKPQGHVILIIILSYYYILLFVIIS